MLKTPTLATGDDMARIRALHAEIAAGDTHIDERLTAYQADCVACRIRPGMHPSCWLPRAAGDLALLRVELKALTAKLQ
jgi:hypothetical protein